MRDGAAAAELAILLPFLAFVFVIGVDWARVFYYSQVIENCARNGAMYAADPKAPANNLYANVTAAALADASDLSPAPTVSSTTGTDADGNGYVAVTVNWTFKTLTNYPGDSNVSLSRTVKMRQAP
jgi:Flp pilus assembly protein TadG